MHQVTLRAAFPPDLLRQRHHRIRGDCPALERHPELFHGLPHFAVDEISALFLMTALAGTAQCLEPRPESLELLSRVVGLSLPQIHRDACQVRRQDLLELRVSRRLAAQRILDGDGAEIPPMVLLLHGDHRRDVAPVADLANRGERVHCMSLVPGSQRRTKVLHLPLRILPLPFRHHCGNFPVLPLEILEGSSRAIEIVFHQVDDNARKGRFQAQHPEQVDGPVRGRWIKSVESPWQRRCRRHVPRSPGLVVRPRVSGRNQDQKSNQYDCGFTHGMLLFCVL